MSVNENININVPGNEKVQQNKSFNIGGSTTEIETRSAPEGISASGNNLSKESTAASPGRSNNNIDFDLSGENSRDDNSVEKANEQKVPNDTTVERATESARSTENSSEAGSPKHENIDVDEVDVTRPTDIANSSSNNDCDLSGENSRDDNSDEKANEKKVPNDSTGGRAEYPDRPESEQNTATSVEVNFPRHENIDVDEADATSLTDPAKKISINTGCDLIRENSQEDNSEKKVNEEKVPGDFTDGGGSEHPESEQSKHENIEVDEPDVTSPADQTSDRFEKLSTAQPDDKETQDNSDKAGQSSEKVDKCEHKEEEPIEVDNPKDNGGSTEEADDGKTQDYKADPASAARDARAHVDYRNEDFNTDSNLDKSETSGKAEKVDKCEHKEEEPIEVDNPKDNGGSTDEADDGKTQEYVVDYASETERRLGNKDFNTDSDTGDSQSESSGREAKSKSKKDMGLGSSKSKDTTEGSSAKKQKCQASSSEDDTDRPWRTDKETERNKPEHNQKKKKKHNKPSSYLPPAIRLKKRQWSDRDTQMYRDGYPNKKDHPKLNLNLKFYKGEIPSKPDGAYIDEFHEHWWGNYDRLESHHGFIQWLFPIREEGMNWHAQELQLHEAKAIQGDKKSRERFIKSYEMMLDFYGIKLVDQETGEVKRADNWHERFRHLNFSMHNYLRITRILKCLGEMGLEHYKVPFLHFMLHEAITTGKLDRTLDSCYNYWIGTVKNDEERAKLKAAAEQMCREVEEALDVGSD